MLAYLDFPFLLLIGVGACCLYCEHAVNAKPLLDDIDQGIVCWVAESAVVCGSKILGPKFVTWDCFPHVHGQPLGKDYWP